MKILIDIDELERGGIVSAPMAATLRKHALRDTGSTAINILLAFGAIAIAAGVLALHPSPFAGALMGLAFVVGGVLKARPASPWRKLGGIWMIVGALILAAGTGVLIDQPLLACLAGAAILLVVGFLAGSRLLIALTPLALLAAIGGSTGYWHACYEIVIKEPTLTVVLFSALSYGGWLVVKATAGLT
jgi:iron complex transport system permease protein